MRLVLSQPSLHEVMAESNACGNAGWNCIVLGDHSVRLLEFAGSDAGIQITLARGTENLFRILPDETIRLSIEFDAAASVIFPSNAASNMASTGAVRFVPVFRVVARSSMPASGSQ
jgi:hypothetical protein